MKTEILIPSLKDSSICIHDISTNQKDTAYEWHIHNECEVIMLLKGKMIFWAGETEYELLPGDIIFVNENVPHKTKTEANSSNFLMQMRQETNTDTIGQNLLRYVNRSNSDSAVFRAGTKINSMIRACIDNIIEENTKKQRAYDIFIKSEVLKIFAILQRFGAVEDISNYFDVNYTKRILPVLEYVDIHYTDNITLEQMSNLLNVDKAHFCRIFKKAVNASFVQYLNFVRVLKAEKLLLKTDKPIAQIAEETGFSSPAYFAEVFKANMSASPSYYKNIKKG